MIPSISVLTLVAILALAFFLGVLNLALWRVLREDRTPLWLAAWLGASAILALCRLLQYAPLNEPLYIVVPRILLTAAYALAWLGYELANTFIDYRPPHRERAVFTLLVAVPILLLWLSDLILTDRIVIRAVLFGGEFHGVMAGGLYLPASLTISALGLLPPIRLWRAQAPHRRENRLLAGGYLFVVLFSLNDFAAVSLNLTWLRLSDYSYLPMAIFFSYIQVQRFGRLYREMNALVNERTAELSRANQALQAEIVERRQAEETIRGSEDQYRRLVEHSPYGVVVHTQGRVAYLNPMGARMIGAAAAEEVLGRPIIDFVHPASRPVVLQRLTDMRAGREVPPLEERFIRLDGGVIDVEVTAYPFTYQNKPAVQVVFHDITERKRAEEKMRRQAVEMTALYETTHDLVVEQDLSRLLRTIVERAAGLLGASGGGLYFCEPQRRQVRCVVSYNTPRDYTGAILEYGEGAAGIVAQTGEPLIVDDYRTWAGRAAIYEQDQPFVSLLSVPMRWQDRVIGVIHVLEGSRTRAFSQADLQIVSLFANQAAIAIENARLFESEERRRQEAVAIAGVGRDISTSLQLEAVLQRIAAHARDLLHADTSAVYSSDPTKPGLRAIAALGPDAEAILRDPLTLGEGILGNIVLRRTGEIVNDSAADPRAITIAGTQNIPHEHLMGVPILSRDQLAGLIAVWRTGAGQEFNAADLDFLSGLAGQAAVAIENARLFDETRRRLTELEIVQKISTALRAAQTLDEMLPVLLDEVLAAIGSQDGGIWLYDAASDDLWQAAVKGWMARFRDVRMKAGAGIVGSVFARQEWHITRDLLDDPLARQIPGDTVPPGLGGVWIPIHTAQETVGVLTVMLPSARELQPEETHVLTTIAEIAGNAIHRASVMATLEQRVAERTRELADANERLKELDRLKDQFVSTVSHELRTPLTNIGLHLNLLDKHRTERLDHYLPILKRETKQLAHLIEDVLTLSRIAQGRMTMLLEPHVLDGLVADVLEAGAARAAAKGLTLIHEPDPDAPAVVCDRMQMIQVFTNLIGNAVAYTPAGGQVAVTTRPADVGVSVHVHNTGPAISPEDLPHLFDRFYRGQTGHESGEPGTGLGLAICKEIVERHGGRITVRSDQDSGTEFEVWLPIADPGRQTGR